jgi:hypothetical protein
VWCKQAPTLLLLLEALTRSVLPHHVLCSSCEVVDRSSSSYGLRSDTAQHLRAILGGFVGSSKSSMLVKLCVNILQHGSSTAAQQQHDSEDQDHQQQQQQRV